MRKSARKIATVLVMSMMLSAVPQCMPTDIGMVKVEAATKKSTKVKYTLKNGVLTIKGKGAMPKSMTFKNNKKVKKVVIKKGVTSISEKAFLNCTKLKEVKIADSVKEIGRKAFCNTGIKDVSIPKSVDNIGENAFAACKKLKTIKMPGDVTMIKSTESPCYLNSNTKVDTITFTTELKLENISYMFANNFDIYSKDKSYKDIEGVIYTKDGKEIVRVPSARKEITVAGECEVFCTNAVYYSVMGEDATPVGACKNLKKVVLPENVKVIDDEKHYAVMSGAPYDVEITEWVINNKQIEGLDELAYAVCGTDTIPTSFYKKFPELVTVNDEMYVSNNTLLYYAGEKTMITVPEGITKIGKRAFDEYRTTAIYGVSLPEGLVEIDDYAFSGQSIKSITIPSTVKKMGKGIFHECEYLSVVDIKEGVTSIGDTMFYRCAALNKITMPSSLITVGEEAFSESGIKEIQLPANVTVIGKDAFRNSKIETITLSNKLGSIGASAFRGTNITSVIIPESVKEIGSSAFAECSKLESVVIENKNIKLANNVFKWSDKVVVKSQMNPKNYVTSIEWIDSKEGKKNKTNTYSWNKNEGATGYQVAVSDNKNFTKNVKKKNVKNNTYDVTVKNGTKKYIKVRTYTVVNGKKVYGVWSEVKSR